MFRKPVRPTCPACRFVVPMLSKCRVDFACHFGNTLMLLTHFCIQYVPLYLPDVFNARQRQPLVCSVAQGCCGGWIGMLLAVALAKFAVPCCAVQ